LLHDVSSLLAIYGYEKLVHSNTFDLSTNLTWQQCSVE